MIIEKPYAIVIIQGKQYYAIQGERISVDYINKEEGEDLQISEVLFYKDKEGNVLVGQPTINMSVSFKVNKHYKEDKIIILKKNQRQNSQGKVGHRTLKTELSVLSINERN